MILSWLWSHESVAVICTCSPVRPLFMSSWPQARDRVGIGGWELVVVWDMRTRQRTAPDIACQRNPPGLPACAPVCSQVAPLSARWVRAGLC